MSTTSLSDAQLRSEIARCQTCAEQPCRGGCPADCSPAEFILAARVGEPSDYRRAAALILSRNPLGGVCGALCPDRLCMQHCSRRDLDRPVDIPAVQAAIVARAKALGVMPRFQPAASTGRRVAVIGAGPAGLATAAVLTQLGHAVEVLDRARRAGGMIRLVPRQRLDPRVLDTDIEWLRGLGELRLRLGRPAPSPRELLAQGFDAVVVATGRTEPVRLGIEGENAAVDWMSFLAKPRAARLGGRRVAIVGVGPVAADCATTAVRAGAAHVELFTRKKPSELELARKELDALLAAGVHVTGRTRLTRILVRRGRVRGLGLRKVDLAGGGSYDARRLADVPRSDHVRTDLDAVILATGARPASAPERHARVFYAGDVENGATTVVQAVAAGKNTAAAVHALLIGERATRPARRTRSTVRLAGQRALPVPLTADFFGREIASPLLLSAAPPTDGLEQMRKAYAAGWAGAVMKTAFDGVPIHIPARYMVSFTERTWGNFDNVSGHSLDRVCREIEQLRREYPDRLTIGSTGGPVTGDDEADARAWQSNTRKLDSAGAMGVEYSLSCPQGGDGTRGDIVSQDAELTAKVVGWIMEVSAPEVPKLFKLTGAVTSIHPIVTAIREVLARHPGKKAGVTLANSFPTLAFRPGTKETWDEGVVVGMSGEGVTPISYLTLAKVAGLGVPVSGNGGPMDYRAAANFLALGARTVQFCTVAMKYGVGIVDELHSGLSHLLAERGLASVAELVGRALPDPVTPFAELPATKEVPAVDRALCSACGNCTRCPYLAVTLDRRGVPRFDAARCIGCSMCVQKCFTGALRMRGRTEREVADAPVRPEF